MDGPVPFILEVSYEIMHRVGGVEALVRSKAPMMLRYYAQNYLLCAPYVATGDCYQTAFEDGRRRSLEWDHLLTAFEREFGLPDCFVKFGTWLIPGSPRCILLPVDIPQNGLMADIISKATSILGETLGLNIADELSQDSTSCRKEAFNFGVIQWCLLSYLMPHFVMSQESTTCLLVQVHGWLSALGMVLFRRGNVYSMLDMKSDHWNQEQIKFVYTAYDTALGRRLSAEGADLAPIFAADSTSECASSKARELGVCFEHSVECQAAKDADALTAVSKLTDKECKHFLGRPADRITWNGLDMDSQKGLVDVHDLQSTHKSNKQKIYDFMQTFFNGIDVQNTQIFFTAQRNVCKNKDIQMFIDSLSIVRDCLDRVDYVKSCSELQKKKIIALIIVPQQHNGFTQHVLESMNLSQEIKIATDVICKQLELNLVDAMCSPDNKNLMEITLDNLVSRQNCEMLQRFQKKVKSQTSNAPLTTHNIVDQKCPIIERLKQNSLNNHPYSRVKVVYIPELLSKTSVFQLDYQDFMRGAHLGVFSSQYKPFGYASPECMSVGTASILSNLCGFSDLIEEVEKKFKNENQDDFISSMEQMHRTSSINLLNQESVERTVAPQKKEAMAGNCWVDNQLGVKVIDMASQKYDAAVNQQAEAMLDYLKLSAYDRIALRNRMARNAIVVDWSVLIKHYIAVYDDVMRLK